ncbi:glycosyltransferase family 4 protein [Priestia megaterium]|uniref:glycosyltransferase family 4 protein n=1 Tax=Priestia megaterium TaxID=1404 RepID=UPI000D52416B|nr:glycosyltransferase family 4 protein [Priestia megaterium]PVE67194.1 glycosyltransferase family 1 protein [Priestia megaterium]PVE84280.1 glycosyltransferase family 1 protein [Priestia megaterium]PVE91383.1 glycosyltransferase family 1 protein [Priestia megaterium]PVE94470.1 glycosyltransferase family 1 protein [Priestia megaterium]
MTKILILANNDVGLYKFRKELINELVKKNEVYISLPNGELIPELVEMGCVFIETSISRRGKNPLTDLKLLMKYNNIIKDIKPNVVLTYTIKPNIYGGLACRINRVPVISNITGLGSAVENKSLLQKITLFLYRRALKKAKCVFFQNSSNANFFIEQKIVTNNYKLIPGSGVNLDYYKLLGYPADSEEMINFLFIARVMKEKGIDEYLEAAIYIRNKYPYTKFHVLGFCEELYEEKLHNLHNEGVIEYHGMQKDIREFHKIAHCIVHPTYYPEGMSNVLLEGAASGRPLITTDRAGCKEVIDDEINGYIVKQQDSQDLIEKIEKFLELKYKEKRQMGLQGRIKVEEEFDRTIVVNSYLQELSYLTNK